MKLRQIKIERVQFEEDDFENAEPQFDAANWKIHVHQQREYQYGRWVNVANLTISKWPRDGDEELQSASSSKKHSPQYMGSPQSPYMLDAGSGIELKHAVDLSHARSLPPSLSHPSSPSRGTEKCPNSPNSPSLTLTQSMTDVCKLRPTGSTDSDSLFGIEPEPVKLL